MFCWDIFWKKQLVQKNADSCPDGSYRLAVSVIAAAIMVIADRKLSGEYHESVLNLMIPLMACSVYLGVRRFFVMHTNIRGTGIIACLGSCAFGVYLLEHICSWQSGHSEYLHALFISAVFCCLVLHVHGLFEKVK